MAVEKRSTANLVQANSANTVDRVVILSDPTGNSQTATITVVNLITSMENMDEFKAAVRGVSTHTADPPSSNSFTGIPQGTFLYDDNYFYVATANNFIKRVAIASF